MAKKTGWEKALNRPRRPSAARTAAVHASNMDTERHRAHVQALEAACPETNHDHCGHY